MLILVQKENDQDQAHIFENIYSEVQLILIFSTNPFIFCIARRFGRRLQVVR